MIHVKKKRRAISHFTGNKKGRSRVTKIHFNILGLETLLVFALGKFTNNYYYSAQQVQVLKWIKDKVSVFEYFQPFPGSFKGNSIVRIVHLLNISGKICRVGRSWIL